ncbi:MAG: cupin-like domain-containing protein [Actinomycetota bacterium]|nr:cupin-like domain-containing protein [Actinomycetota bacterium]
MPMWDSVPVLDTLTAADFAGDFVGKRRPVVMRGATAGWQAREWDPARFRRLGGSARLGVKVGRVAEGRQARMTIAEYAEALERYEASLATDQPLDNPGYLHDVPIFRFFPELAGEAAPFPLHLLPRWYHRTWQEYAQFFMGPSGSSTPLHFDTLLTHNLFFHLSGHKRFVLIPAEQRRLCYPTSWRWMAFDPAEPDLDRFPLAAEVKPVTVDLQPGDTLYMPSGTLHHVSNQTPTVAFNIDWHTADSARDGVFSVARGAPWKNGYYNALSWLGVGAGVPERYIFAFYKSYLTYVS